MCLVCFNYRMQFISLQVCALKCHGKSHLHSVCHDNSQPQRYGVNKVNNIIFFVCFLSLQKKQQRSSVPWGVKLSNKVGKCLHSSKVGASESLPHLHTSTTRHIFIRSLRSIRFLAWRWYRFWHTAAASSSSFVFFFKKETPGFYSTTKYNLMHSLFTVSITNLYWFRK